MGCQSVQQQPMLMLGLALILFVVLIFATSSVQAQIKNQEALANVPQYENRPTEEAATLLMDELLFQRASQIYLGRKKDRENA